MTMSHLRKGASTDPRDQRLQRKRLLTELSAKPFAVPEDEYGTHRVATPVLHPLTPEIVPAPPESNLRSAVRSISWRLIGWTGFATSAAAAMALIAVEMLPLDQMGRLEVAFPSMQKLQSGVVAPPASTSLEAATKIAQDFESFGGGQVQPSVVEHDEDATLRRLMEWEKNAQATPPR